MIKIDIQQNFNKQFCKMIFSFDVSKLPYEQNNSDLKKIPILPQTTYTYMVRPH